MARDKAKKKRGGKKARRKKARKAAAGSEALLSGADRAVAIDIDVHRRIEAARLSFEETDNAILRRLLGLDGGADAAGRAIGGMPDKGARAKGGGAAEGGWTKISRNGQVVFLPDGTRLRAAYGGIAFTGRIENGAWKVANGRYTSPSAALNAVARTRAGGPVNLNGWRHWEVLPPGAGVWVRLRDL